MTGALWETLYEGWASGATAALATVVSTFGSAPRAPGSMMLLTTDGQVVGSVSGGCVEGDVLETAREVVADGRARLVSYGVSDDDAFAVGLTCGGTIEVFVEPVDVRAFPELAEVMESARAGIPVAVVTVLHTPANRSGIGTHFVVRDDGHACRTGTPSVTGRIVREARELLRRGESATLLVEAPGGPLKVFVSPLVPPPRLLVFGAGDFAAALSAMGRLLGHRVTVCDARPAFTGSDRFPDADEVVVSRPDRYLAQEAEAGRLDARTAVVSLTHDPKFEVPLIERALKEDVAYVGAMGSRRSHRRLVTALRESGVPEARLARLASPIGLDLGGRTPAETALSIAAEMVALRHGGSGLSLAHRTGPVHGDARRTHDVREHREHSA